MATRTLEIDLRQGTGASSEPMYGVVTVQRAKAKSAGGFEILPFETTLKLINGKATITEAETDGTGPLYDSVYLFRVQNGYCAPRWGFMAALPDGSTPITTGELPMVDPITGEGIYMDAQEWNALYGTLPNRVTSLETGKANTAHTHAIGDVTGLQPALNAKGNAAMRVDSSVGTRVFISDGVTERMVSGDTGWRKVIVAPKAGVHSGGEIRWRRSNDTVQLFLVNITLLEGAGFVVILDAVDIPFGFRAISTDRAFYLIGLANSATTAQVVSRYTSSAIAWNQTLSGSTARPTSGGLQGVLEWTTDQAWPTTLPGTPA